MADLTPKELADVKRIQAGIAPKAIADAHAALQNEDCTIQRIRKAHPELLDKHTYPDHLVLGYKGLSQQDKLDLYRAEKDKQSAFNALTNEAEAVAKKLKLDDKTVGDTKMPIALRAAVDITSAFSSACSPKFPMPDIKIDTYKDQEAKAKIPRRNSGMMV